MLCPFSEDDGTLSYRELDYLYEKNPATKGLDFGDYPEEKEPFLRYSASFQLQNRVEELQRYSLPSLHDLSDGIEHELRLYDRRDTHAQRGLVRLIRVVSALEEWVPPQGGGLYYNISLNRHLGQSGLMTPVATRTTTNHARWSLPLNTRPDY